MTPMEVDVAIVGAGIAGASLAHFVAPHARVALLERETQPGYHSTGRSAALFIEGYGTPQVRALTRASRAFLVSPPSVVAPAAVISPRGVLTLATREQVAALDQEWEALSAHAPGARVIDGAAARAMVPVLRDGMFVRAIHDPDASDIDVHTLHQGYLRSARANGATLLTGFDVQAIERAGDDWRVHARDREVRASLVVDAAGAWADAVAAAAGVAPLGLQPRRRAAFTFAPPQGIDTRRWPAFVDAGETFYVKPDAGVLLGSPANADPVPPHDVRPEELDIATGIDRIERHTTMTIRRPIATWAGLRSFVEDGDLVGGFDAQAPGFFWLCAQGGYGIQTSAAMGETCAHLLLGRGLPERLESFGITAGILSPARLRRHA